MFLKSTFTLLSKNNDTFQNGQSIHFLIPKEAPMETNHMICPEGFVEACFMKLQMRKKKLPTCKYVC